MTETMMIIIVAGAVIVAFGLLCLVFIFRSQKETEGFSKKIAALEKDLGDMTKMVSDNAAESQKADENILEFLKKQEEKCAAKEAERKAKEAAQKAVPAPAPAQAPEPKPQPAPAPAAPKSQTAAAPPPIPATPKPEMVPVSQPQRPAIVTPAVEIGAEANLGFDEININDLLDDLEDVLPELTSNFEPDVLRREPVTIAPPLEHIDYDIGQSGRKYTASELEALIRE